MLERTSWFVNVQSLRFTIGQLLMAIALFGIALLFLQSGGCGSKYHHITEIGFSPDGAHLAVVHYSYRDANVTLKRYTTDITRVIELISIDGERRTTLDICHFPGNRGPFARAVEGPEIAFSPSNQNLVVILQDRATLRLYDPRSSNHTDLRPEVSAPLSAIRFSPEGDVLVLGESLKVLSTWSFPNLERRSRVVRSLFFLNRRYRPVCLSVAPGANTALLCDDMSASQVNFLNGQETQITTPGHPSFIQVNLDGTSVLVACRETLALYQPNTNVQKELKPEIRDLECLAASRNLSHILALERSNGRDSRIYILDLDSNELPISAVAQGWSAAAAFSPDGNRVAFSVDDHIEVHDVSTGQLVATFRVEPRHRFPWTLPSCALAVWLFAIYWRSRKVRQAYIGPIQLPTAPRSSCTPFSD